MDEVVKRVMPHSNEAEQAVIGAMLMDADAISVVGEILKPEDFYQKNYAELFTAMVNLSNAGKTCDLVTVKAQLEEQGVSSEIISIDTIKSILDMVTTSANVKQYAEIVREKSVLRKLARTTDDISNRCYAGKEPLEDILKTTEKDIFDIIQNGAESDVQDIKDVAIRVINKIEKASQSHGAVTGIPTGFKRLDKQLTGLQPSDLILVAARPSVGKTALVLNIAEHVAIKNNIPVAFFSLEMSADQLVQRLLAQNSMIDAQKLRTGNLNEKEWEISVESINTIGYSKLYIDDTSGLDINVMRSKCRKLKMEKDIQLIIVDYMQLMEASTTHAQRTIGSREQEIALISRTLKGIARELNVPVVALSQLNRMSVKSEDKKPTMDNLRESGSLEQDADVVLLLSRYYDKEKGEEVKNRIIVDVAKQRNGPTGEVELVWLGEYMKFENPENQNI